MKLLAALKKIVGDVEDGWDLDSFSAALYHGSPKPVDNFDVSKGDGRFGKGLYLTPSVYWAEFYSKGGRQGGPSTRTKDKKRGHVYEFNISADRAMIVNNEEDFLMAIRDGVEEADKYYLDEERQIYSHATQFAEEMGCDILVFDPKDSGVLSPTSQVVLLDNQVIKGQRKLSDEEIEELLKEHR